MISKFVFALALVCFGQFAIAQDFPGSNPPATDPFTSNDSAKSVTLFDSNVRPASYDAPLANSDSQPDSKPLVTAQRDIMYSVLQFAIAIPVVAIICFLAIRYSFFRKQDLFEVGPDGERPFKRWF